MWPIQVRYFWDIQYHLWFNFQYAIICICQNGHSILRIPLLFGLCDAFVFFSHWLVDAGNIFYGKVRLNLSYTCLIPILFYCLNWQKSYSMLWKFFWHARTMLSSNIIWYIYTFIQLKVILIYLQLLTIIFINNALFNKSNTKTISTAVLLKYVSFSYHASSLKDR